MSEFNDMPEEFRLYLLALKALPKQPQFPSADEAVAGWERILATWERFLRSSRYPEFALSWRLPALGGAGSAYLRRYHERGQLGDLERALDQWKEAAELAPPGSTDQPRYLNDLGIGLRERYACTGNPIYLEQAVQAWEQAVELTPADAPDLPDRLNNLSLGLLERYTNSGELFDLEKAIRLIQQAVKKAPPGSPIRPRYLSNLGKALMESYLRTGDLDALKQALKLWQEAVELTQSSSPDLPGNLNNLGVGLDEYYKHSKERNDLERAIQSFEEAIGVASPDSPDRPSCLSNLGNALRERYAQTGELGDLEQAIHSYEEAIKETIPGSPDWLSRLNNLSAGLRDRYSQIQDMNDLERAIQLINQVVEGTPPNSPVRPVYLNNLGLALMIRYTRANKPADLERAIRVWQQTVDLTQPDSRGRHEYLNNLGVILKTRYDRFGDLADLEQAMKEWERAAEHAQNSSLEQFGYLNNLCIALKEHFEHTGNMADLDCAILLSQQVIEQIPKNLVSQSAHLNNLGNCLQLRYDRTGDLADLEWAIQVWEEAVELTPPDEADRALYLNNLAIGLRARYARTGDLADLEQATQSWEEAVELMPASSSSRSDGMGNLGNGLKIRYTRTGDLDDLERAIQILEKLVEHIPDGSAEKPSHLINLANVMIRRYDHTRSLVDLERAIQFSQRSLELVPFSSSHRSLCKNTLSVALRTRYSHLGNLADLEQAIQIWEQEVELSPIGSPERGHLLHNLGAALGIRYESTEDPVDLERAIVLLEQGAEQCTQDSPDDPMYLSSLGMALMTRYESSSVQDGRVGIARQRNEADLIRASKLFKEACQSGKDLDPEESLHAALIWGDWALRRSAWTEAVEAYKFGLEASEQLFRVQLLRTSKEAWLRASRGLHTRAAYALAQAGDLRGAVETQEWGRARLLSQNLERDRADLVQLKSLSPTIYGQYMSASNELRSLEDQDIGDLRVLPPGYTLPDAMRQARKALDEAVEGIRKVPGYEEFLKPPTFDTVVRSLGDAPLVYNAVTPMGGLALIVSLRSNERIASDSSEGSGVILNATVKPCWLGELTEKDLYKRIQGLSNNNTSESYLGTYLRWRNSLCGQSTDTSWFAQLEETTRWLWDVMMGPLVEALSHMKVAHCILVPQGLLGLFPLHAAWIKDATATTGRRYALDTITFSYISNARALNVAKSIALRIDLQTLLIIDEPLPVSASKLDYSKREIEAARNYFATSCVLDGEKATRTNILSALSADPPPSVWHFSCHGSANFKESLASGMLLANDEKLTLSDLLALHLSGVRLAVLSACETGILGGELPDEVISLPTGLMQAGVAGVVASLWTVSQKSTMLLLFRFYDLWRERGLIPVEALHQAQIWVRDTTNKEKADYFRGFLPEFAVSKTTVAVADELYKDLMLHPPEQRDFVHPFYWAAFSFTGV